MLINYFKQPFRKSPVNLLVVRILFGLYVIWKIISYEWLRIFEWPTFFLQDHPHAFFLKIMPLSWLPYEIGLSLVLTVIFMLGLWRKVIPFVLALLLIHMTGIHYIMTNSGATFIPIIFFLVLYAIYQEQDVLSIDGLRKLWKNDRKTLVHTIQGDNKRYNHSLLGFFTIIVGIIYFFTGYIKIITGLFNWLNPGRFNGTLLVQSTKNMGEPNFFTQFFLNSPILAYAGPLGTVVLEVGLIFAILFSTNITLVAIGLLMMHTLIALTMGVFFFDQYLLFLLLLPWDRIANGFSKKKLDLVYDEECYFCNRSLLFFRLIDTAQRINFFSQSTLPKKYEGKGQYNKYMYCFIDGKAYKGYYAFKQIAKHSLLLYPAYIFCLVPGINFVGEKIYGYVAKNRGEIFACKI